MKKFGSIVAAMMMVLIGYCEQVGHYIRVYDTEGKHLITLAGDKLLKWDSHEVFVLMIGPYETTCDVWNVEKGHYKTLRKGEF